MSRHQSLLIRKLQLHSPETQIKYSAAVPAYKMVMGRRIVIKMIRSLREGQLPYLSAFRKKIEIAVYGTETDIRKFLPDLDVDLISRRVRAFGKEVFDGLSLL